MRVLINGLSARLGGGQTYLRNLLLHTPEEWNLYLLCPDNFDLAGLPANVTCVNHPQLDNPFLRAIWEYVYLGTMAKSLNIDVLFCPGGLLPPCLLPAKTKTVVTFQNMLPFDTEQRKRYPFGYRRLRDWLLARGLSSSMRKADLVIFISQFAQQFITAKLGRLQGKSVVIPHGIAPQFFPGSKPRPAYAPQGPYVLYVSYIDYYKSQLEVVRAFALMREQSKIPLRLLLAGAENPAYGDLLRNEIAQLHLEDAVYLLGNVPHHDLPSLYQNADINLFASCTENCPNILLEMMASGRPALVSTRGPMPEFGGNCVTYFNPDQPEQLAAQWMEVLTQPEHAQTMAAQALTRVSSMTWEKAARASWGAMAGLV